MAHTKREVIIQKLEKAKSLVEVGATYRHAKSGSEYIVIDIVIQEENEEIRVIYKELNHEPPIIWDRSLEDEGGWLNQIIFDGKSVERFTKVTS